MAKRKITNETAKKKFKELYNKYNGDVDKVKEELFNKYDFDYKTVTKEVIKEIKAEQKQTKQSKTKKPQGATQEEIVSYMKDVSEKKTFKSKSIKGKQPTGFELPNYKQPEVPNRNPEFVRKISDEEAFKELTKLKNDPQALLNFLKANDFPSKPAWQDVINKNPQGITQLGEEDPSKGFGGKGRITLDLNKSVEVYKELLRKHNGDFDKALNELYRDYDVKDKKAFETLVNQVKFKYQQSKNTNKQLPPTKEYPLAKVETPSTGEAKTPPTGEAKTENTTLVKAEKPTEPPVEDKGFLSKASEYASKYKKYGVIAGILGAGAYAVDKLFSRPQQPTQTQEQPTQAQQEQQQPQPQEQQSPLQSAPSYPDYSDDIKQLQQSFLQLVGNLDKQRQAYDLAMNKYMQANDLYEKQLAEILPSISLLLAKTPLNNMTNEDLIQHTNTLFTEMPYEDALNRVGNLTKGYYVAKMNGVDPKSLSTTDLLEIAENPVFAKSTNENLAQFLSQIGEVLKYKIKNNLDKIGAIKDMYGNTVKELHEQANVYKELFSTVKQEMLYTSKMRDEDIKYILGNRFADIKQQQAENKGGGKGGKEMSLPEVMKKVREDLQKGQYSPEAQKDIQKDLKSNPNLPPLRFTVGATQ